MGTSNATVLAIQPGGELTHDTIPPESLWLADRYEFLEELGRGGMATVYLARDRETRRYVAVKLVDRRHTADSEAVRRFALEARTAATLQHPNIVQTLAIEEFEGSAVAIVNAYVHGRTLRDELDQSGPFTFERTVHVLRDVAAALAHAHACRIVHRDVKPANILLEATTGRALLSDFGIARPLDNNTQLTVAGFAIGTPTYMSPEQIDGRPVTERADVYALGLVGWEMLTARRPWDGETLYAVLHKQQHAQLPDLAQVRPDIPVFLLNAIDVALAKDPDKRWADAAEFLVQLNPTSATVDFAALPERVGEEGEGDESTDATVRIVTRPERDGRGTYAYVSGNEAAGGNVSEESAESVYEPAVSPSVGKANLVRTGTSRGSEYSGVAEPDRGAHPRRAWRVWPAAVALIVAIGVLALVVFLPSGPSAMAHSRTPAPAVDPELDSLLRLVLADSVVNADSGKAGRSTSASASASPPFGPATLAAGSIDARCRSTVSRDQRACLLASIERGDVVLTRAYDGLISKLRSQAGGVREPATVRALRAEERAWVVTRDKQCRDRARGSEGTLWGLARIPCFAETSARRAVELRSRTGSVRGSRR